MHDPLDFEKSDKDNILLDCSMGTAFILNSFALLSQLKTKLTWDTILINVFTLVRNNIHNDDDGIDDIIKGTNKDIDMIMSYISEYNSILPDLESPYIVFYLPTYNIPFLHARKPTPKYKKMEQVIKKLINQLDGPYEKALYPNYTAYVVKVGGASFPHIDLARWLNKINAVVKRTYNRRYLMISHCPIDFHIHKHYRNFQLLESYTGRVKVPSQFGEKIFKYGNNPVTSVPFTDVTHILFGDKVHIQPLATRQDRKKIIEISLKANWNKMTNSMILDNIKKLNILPIDMLKNIKF